MEKKPSIVESNELPFISVVIPVLNGEGRLEHCLESLNNQNYPRDRYEVIVADAMSVDRTQSIAEEMGAIVVKNPKVVLGAGRNVGIHASSGDFIVFTDDDCVLPENWLITGSSLLLDNPSFAGVGGPTPIPESSGVFSQAVNQIFLWASMAGYSVQSGHKSTVKANDLPGGNSMYRKEVLLDVGDYREDLAEDVDYHIRMKRKGYQLLFAKDFYSWHHKRSTIKGFYLQAKRFARGRVRLGREAEGVVRPLHWLAAFIPVLTIIIITLLLWGGYTALFGIVVIGGIISIMAISYIESKSLQVSFLSIFTLALFMAGWSTGFFRELIYPSDFQKDRISSTKS